jgi:putative transposase
MQSLQPRFALSELAQVLEVSRSGFLAHEGKADRPRRQTDQRLKPLLQQAFSESRQTYGCPRLRQALQKTGYRCGKQRIARLMRQLGLRPKQKRRFRPVTTQSDPRRAAAPNWLAQVPAPMRPNQVWVSDITYLPTAQGWLFLAATLDAYSRKCVGYSLDDSLDCSLVTEAWERAQRNRRPGPGLLHHSDRGIQYTSSRFQRLLLDSHATPSMSHKGNPYDNALMESFFATLKTECFGHELPATKEQAKLMVFDYIETFYNPRRLHSALGYRSPVEFESQFN